METNNIEMITKMVIDAINKNEDKGNGFVVPIGVSARHIHLTQEHVEALFGEGYQLTKKKDLMGGQFASNETVTIVGLKLRAIENVRILGPVHCRTERCYLSERGMYCGHASHSYGSEGCPGCGCT